MLHKEIFGKSRLVRSFCAALVLCAATSAVRADVVALFPFNGNSLASTDTNTQSTAGSITLGSGLTDTTRFTTGASPAPSLRVNSDETDGTDFASALAANDFFTFTLAPASGYRFVFQNFTVALATNDGAITTNIRLQASINGSTFVNVDTVSGFSNAAFTTETFDLTFGNNNAAIQNGASVLLRVLVYDNVNSATEYTAFDNITVNATLQAIPEPGTAALVALGATAAGGLILRRRKR